VFVTIVSPQCFRKYPTVHVKYGHDERDIDSTMLGAL